MVSDQVPQSVNLLQKDEILCSAYDFATFCVVVDMDQGVLTTIGECCDEVAAKTMRVR